MDISHIELIGKITKNVWSNIIKNVELIIELYLQLHKNLLLFIQLDRNFFFK